MTDPASPSDPQERRALIAVVLCLAVFFVWSSFFGPKTPPAAPTPEEAAATAPATPEPTPAVAPPVSTPVEAACVNTTTPFTTGDVAMDVASCNGGVAAIRFPEVKAPAEVVPWWSWVYRKVTGEAGGWAPYTDVDAVETLMKSGSFGVAGRGDFAPAGTYEVVSTEPLVIRRQTSDGLRITQTFTKTDSPDLVQLAVRFDSAVPLQGPFWVGVADTFEKIVKQTDSHPALQAGVDGSLWLLSGGGKRSGCQGMWSSIAPGELHENVGWLGVADRYFIAAMIPDEPDLHLRYEPLEDGRTAAYVMAPAASIGPDAPIDMKFTIYAGKKDASRLVELGHDLDEAMSLGLFGFFSRILLFFLHLFQKGIGNWGLSIIALTFFVRLCFYPLSAAAFRNGKKMQMVQPKLKEMQEKFKDDKDAQTKATMALFQEHQVNPLGGCLPIFFQIPVFLALYSGLQQTPDLFGASFLYLHDLSGPDPLGLFPFLIFVGMVIQQRFTPMQGMDPQQQTMMKLMPFIFSFMMFGLPAGLSLYYAVNSGLAILQQWYNTRSYGTAAPGSQT